MTSKHTISCFDGTLQGWNKESPEKKHVRQSSLLHQLHDNLHRYEDPRAKGSKSKQQVQHVRLPLLTNSKSNINLEPYKFQQKSLKNDHQFNIKKALPLRMKTLMIYEKNENQNHQHTNKKLKLNPIQNKDKFRRKVVVNFERQKEIGMNCLQFSDEMFFRDNISKSVKLYPIYK